MTGAEVAMVAGVGLVGLGPVGGAVALSALMGRASRTALAVFAIVTLGVTTALGLAGVYAGHELRSRFDPAALSPVVLLVVQALVGAAIGTTAVWMWARRRGRPRTPGSPSTATSVPGLAVAGTLVALLSVPKPPFVALVAWATTRPDVLDQGLTFAIWSLVSQCPLYLLCAAGLLGLHGAAADRVESWRARWGSTAGALVTVLVLVLASLLIADAVSALLTDRPGWMVSRITGG